MTEMKLTRAEKALIKKHRAEEAARAARRAARKKAAYHASYEVAAALAAAAEYEAWLDGNLPCPTYNERSDAMAVLARVVADLVACGVVALPDTEGDAE